MARTKIHLGVAAFVASLLGPWDGTAATDEVFARARRQMVDEIAAMARSTRQETGRERFAERVMDAMGKVPRHRFVPERVARDAYRNHPLPIGGGQTISQPYIVALSTELINPQSEHVVLEIGTGSGYQAAVLAGLVKHVYSIEIVEPLGKSAADRLAALGYSNVAVRVGDGYQGWPEHALFDGIIVTAAAPSIPAPLREQLNEDGGRLVIPVGDRRRQDLLLVTRHGNEWTERNDGPCVFVPLVGVEGFPG